jgi:hypothetical protein
MNMLVREYTGTNQTITSVIAGSASNENFAYNFHSDEDGLIEVMAVPVANFPREGGGRIL